MSIQVGIDLGTSNSLIATEINGKIKILKFGTSEMLRSVLYYDGKEVLIGDKAQKKGIMNPVNQIRSSKTYMGDPAKNWTLADRTFTPTDVAAEILLEIKKKIISSLKLDDAEVIEAVITVPAYFTSNQIDETKKAGEKAGLTIKSIITEPVAAAIAYGETLDSDEQLFVIDLGGGTFDVSILKISDSGAFYNTIAIDGNHRLGGDDFDKKVLELFVAHLQSVSGIDLSSYSASGLDDNSDYLAIMAQLSQEAEKAKIELSEAEEYEAAISNLFYHNGKDYHLQIRLTRKDFEKACQKLLTEIEETTKRCLKNANLSTTEIDKVVLVGGSAYIPAVYNITKKIFNKDPYSDQDLSTLVVTGASLVASQTGLTKIKDIISHSLGIEVLGKNGTMELEKLLFKNRPYPCSFEKTFTTAGNYQEEVNINIWEGEVEEDVEMNEFYGGFVLDGIEKALAGEPQIKVTFEFDSNRILTVTAEDLKTHSHKKVQVKKGVRLESAKATPIDFSVLIDCSGSMDGEPINLAKDACKKLVTDIINLDIHRLGVISFGSYATVISGLSQDKQQLLKQIGTISINGSTNMHDAFSNSINMLESSSRDKVCIVVTDGAPDDKNSVITITNEAKRKGIRVIAIGAGSVDSDYLKKISTTAADYHHVNNMSGLKDVFETVINALQRM